MSLFTSHTRCNPRPSRLWPQANALLLTLATLLCLIPAAQAQSSPPAGPPTEPQLRIEAGMHTSVIRSISSDASGRYAVTASDDKTARVWDVTTGRLLQVLRPPIAAGDEGKLYATSMAPNGETVAVAGWTKLGSSTGHTVYLFDRSTGQLRQRPPETPGQARHSSRDPNARSVEQRRRRHKASGIAKAGHVLPHLGAMGVAVKHRQRADQAHGNGHRHRTAQRRRAPDHDGRNRNAKFDIGQAETADPGGKPQNHHANKAQRHQKKRASTQNEGQDPDRDHGQHMIDATDGMGKAMQQAIGMAGTGMGERDGGKGNQQAKGQNGAHVVSKGAEPLIRHGFPGRSQRLISDFWQVF